ncbi:MAG: amidohydrolase family protein [bacterium]
MEILFVDGRVLVGNGCVMERASVLIEGERIVRVWQGEGPLPDGVPRVKIQGCTLLPGLIDAHVHLCLDGSPDPMEVLERTPDALLALRIARHARQTLLGGVTSIRDMGGKNGVDLVAREAIRDGMMAGPRMLASGRPIVMTGGHGWQMAREADGPEELRKAAREQIKAGADVIKLMATGGVMTRGVEPGSAQLTEEEMRAAVEEAHKAGRRTAAHAQGAQGILNALRAGIDSIEHGIFLDQRSLDYMLEKDIPLVPTISALQCIEDNGVQAGIPAFVVEKTKRLKSDFLQSINMAREAGIRVAMGTDAGTPFNFHGQNLRELELMASLGGFSPGEAIRAATQVGAQVLGLEKELGTIEEGKLADLIVVRGNPLEDLSLLRNKGGILWILKGGKPVVADGRIQIDQEGGAV